MDRILLRYTENTEAYESRNNDDVARVRDLIIWTYMESVSHL